MAAKEHFNYLGITKLATLNFLTNYGLSDSLKEAFPNINTSLIYTISIPNEIYNYSSWNVSSRIYKWRWIFL
jgi:hypothetical protein